MRVLLVDDDSRMRQVLAKLLESAGIGDVDTAGDGQEALDRLSNGGVDLVLTDCAMPRMDGIALVTALRARGDRTPVIMLSGHDDPTLVVRAIRAGVDNYVPKPIHPETLFEKIWQTLGVSRAVALELLPPAPSPPGALRGLDDRRLAREEVLPQDRPTFALR